MVSALARALAEGAAVAWDDPDRPRLVNVSAERSAELRCDPDAVRAVLRRAVAFRRAIPASGAVPLLRMTDAAEVPGACFSCGEPSASWRCRPCLLAAYIALDRTAHVGLVGLTT